MRKWTLIIASLLLIGSIGGILGYKFVYNKPHRDYEKASPDFEMRTNDLFSMYQSTRADAESTYNGMVIQLTGKIYAVETIDSMTIVVFAIQEGMFGDEGIRCTMLPAYNDEASRLNAGQNVKLKGYCTGYNDTDVILEKCSIL